MFVAILFASPAAAQKSWASVLDEADALAGRSEYVQSHDLAATVPDSAPADLVARKHRRMALSLINLGRFSEVPGHLEQARALASASGSAAEMARSAMVESRYQLATRAGDRGIAEANRGVELATKSGDRRLLGQAYEQVGSACLGIEDWERGMYYNEKGFELLDRPTVEQRFNHAMQRGIAYFELYERDAAEAQYTTALALARELNGKRHESFARGELAYTYWTFDRDAPRALELYQQAIDLAIAARARPLESAWRLNRGSVRRDMGDHQGALEDFATVLRLAGDDRRNTFIAGKNTGQTLRLMGRLPEARRTLERLLASPPVRPTVREQWQAQMELASTYEALALSDLADAHYKEMMTLLEEQRHSAILDTFRTGTFAHTMGAYEPYHRYARFLLERDPGPAGAAASLQIVEQARARSFLEMLKPARSSVAARLPPALLEEESRILREISRTQEHLRAGDRPRDARERLLGQLASLEEERERFRLKLRVEYPALAEARYPELASLPELQKTLRPGEVALSFVLSEPHSFRWTIRRDGVAASTLPGRSAIEARAARVRALARVPSDGAALEAAAAGLATLLFADLPLADEAPVVVIPHGVLNYIPFDILPLGGAPLIERHAVSYAPSLNALAQLRRLRGEPDSFRVLAIGDPVVTPAAPPTAVRGADVDSLALLGPLPFARDELRAIRRTLPGAADTLSGADATESALRRAGLARYSVIHFATHGLVHDTRPSRSGLLLSRDGGDDGLLQTTEIYGLDLRSDLVVLSACQTALGREITGEGILGLTRAFFFAGSRAVVATLWNLNDRFAAQFIRRFYDGIHDGLAPEEALRRAKISYLHDATYGHPFYWASPVLIGDGTRILAAGTDRSTGLHATRTLWASVLSMLALFAVLRTRLRRS